MNKLINGFHVRYLFFSEIVKNYSILIVGLTWDSSSKVLSTTHLTEFSLTENPGNVSSGISGGGVAGTTLLIYL